MTRAKFLRVNPYYFEDHERIDAFLLAESDASEVVQGVYLLLVLLALVYLTQ